MTSPDKVERWVMAAGQTGKSKSVIDRVITAGDFLEKTGRMSEKEACECLTGVDFSKPVMVVKLTKSIYVQYVQRHKGVWFTDTGLTPDAVGLATGRRLRTLFTPAGTVHALKCTARSITDFWTGDKLFQLGTPAEREKIGQATKGRRNAVRRGEPVGNEENVSACRWHDLLRERVDSNCRYQPEGEPIFAATVLPSSRRDRSPDRSISGLLVTAPNRPD